MVDAVNASCEFLDGGQSWVPAMSQLRQQVCGSVTDVGFIMGNPPIIGLDRGVHRATGLIGIKTSIIDSLPS